VNVKIVGPVIKTMLWIIRLWYALLGCPECGDDMEYFNGELCPYDRWQRSHWECSTCGKYISRWIRAE